MKKKCSCDRIAESDPLVTSEPRRTLVTTRPPLLTPQITMKKVCSCEPGGPLCFLDPLVTYDWKKRPKRENCDLTEPDPYLEWKVSHILATLQTWRQYGPVTQHEQLTRNNIVLGTSDQLFVCFHSPSLLSIEFMVVKRRGNISDISQS